MLTATELGMRKRALAWCADAGGNVVSRDQAINEEQMALDVLELIEEVARLRSVLDRWAQATEGLTEGTPAELMALHAAELEHHKRALAERDVEVARLRKWLDDYKDAVTAQLHYDARSVLTGTPEERARVDLNAARAEIERLRFFETTSAADAIRMLNEARARLALIAPVFEAAKAWKEDDGYICLDHQGCGDACRACALFEAIDAALAASPRPGAEQ